VPAGAEAVSTQRRRVLFVNQYFPPDEASTAQILGDLVEAACREGFECRVVTSDRGYADPKLRYPRRESWRGASVERLWATGFGRGSTAGRALDYATFIANACVRLLSGPRPDVVVGLSTPPILGALAVLVARLRGARSVYWTMDVHPEIAFALGILTRASLAGRAFSALSGWTLRSADLVVALGETMAGLLRRQGARRVAVVHNWADEDAIRPIGVEASTYRAERGWGSRFVVVYSGNMGLAHEFETVLAAADRLRSQLVTFAFIGDGPRRKEVERGVAARGLANVEFHPGVPRPALGDSLTAADLHLVTLRPGMQSLLVPSKIYGILAAGRPTLYVGPAEGEVYDIVTGAGCGTVVANGSVDALVAAILDYEKDRTRLEREGRAGRDFLEERLGKAEQTRRFLQELRALATSGPGARRPS
jgi:colanic acid biosynthesis glycosyl transferase WcaI